MNKRTQTIQNNNAAASRLSRRLIELGEYAKREGISPQDVRKCADIGIVQLRLHKDKTFVVDMPVCSYDNNELIDAEVEEILGLNRYANQTPQQPVSPPPKSDTAKKAVKSPSTVKTPDAKPFQAIRNFFSKNRNKSSLDKQNTNTASKPDGRSCPSIRPGSISQLVQEMLQRAEQIKEQDRKEITRTKTAPSITEFPQTSKKQSCQMTEELFTTINRQLDQLEKACPKPKERLTPPPHN